jgi:uncharacterized membrane protein
MPTRTGRRTEASLRAARRLTVTVVGGLLVLVGLAALVLPGPGMLLCILGLLVLASEYDWAERGLQRVQDQSRRSIERGAASRVTTYASVAGGLVLLALGVLELAVGLPLMTSFTAVTLLLSGVVVVGTTTWSRRRHLRSSAGERDCARGLPAG